MTKNKVARYARDRPCLSLGHHGRHGGKPPDNGTSRKPELSPRLAKRKDKGTTFHMSIYHKRCDIDHNGVITRDPKRIFLEGVTPHRRETVKKIHMKLKLDSRLPFPTNSSNFSRPTRGDRRAILRLSKVLRYSKALALQTQSALIGSLIQVRHVSVSLRDYISVHPRGFILLTKRIPLKLLPAFLRILRFCPSNLHGSNFKKVLCQYGRIRSKWSDNYTTSASARKRWLLIQE